MCEFETATDAPITYAELEVLIRLIIEDFTLLKAAEIKKEPKIRNYHSIHD